MYVTFGKFKGRPYTDVVKDESYCNWIVDNIKLPYNPTLSQKYDWNDFSFYSFLQWKYPIAKLTPIQKLKVFITEYCKRSYFHNAIILGKKNSTEQRKYNRKYLYKK